MEETGYAAGAMREVCTLFANPATHTNRIHTFVTAEARLSGPTRTESSGSPPAEKMQERD